MSLSQLSFDKADTVGPASFGRLDLGRKEGSGWEDLPVDDTFSIYYAKRKQSEGF
jgi:hypothetical protein